MEEIHLMKNNSYGEHIPKRSINNCYRILAKYDLGCIYHDVLQNDQLS